MPTLMEIFGYKIYFWSNEGMPLEPIHVHISKKPHHDSTKIWILQNGKCEIANNNDNIPQKHLKELIDTISIYRKRIEKMWQEKFKVDQIVYKTDTSETLEEENDYQR